MIIMSIVELDLNGARQRIRCENMPAKARHNLIMESGHDLIHSRRAEGRATEARQRGGEMFSRFAARPKCSSSATVTK